LILRRPTCLLAGLILACGSGADQATTSSAVVTTASNSASPTTTSPPIRHLIETDSIAGLPIEIYGPPGRSDDPVVVMFHGGGWYGGGPVSMTGLADFLAGKGMVVFNATYRTASGGFPASFNDVSCAIRYANGRANEFSSVAETVSVVAHSAGAHLAAVVALAGDDFGGQCPDSERPTMGHFVGIAGPYDPTLYALLLAQYFGTRLEDDPEPWEAGSPYSYLGRNPGLEFLLAHGESDELVPVESSELFYEALVDAGYRATLEILPRASHLDSDDPDLVGDVIAEFLSE
jgi:acetyl esterase/lipase